MIRSQDMRIRFHGVRGSRPVHRNDSFTTGGNSTCLELVTPLDASIFIDCGTGINQLFPQKLSQGHFKRRIHILVTHTHWDHVMGLVNFAPLFDKSYEVHFYASTGSNGRFEDLFKTMFQSGLSGIANDSVKAKVLFHEVGHQSTFLIDGLIKVETLQVNHQAITLGFKFSFGDQHICVITDMAPIENGNLLGDNMREFVTANSQKKFEKKYYSELHAFLKQCDIVVMDTHFNEDNFKPDWGHQTPEIAIDLCVCAKVATLVMFHHAPEDNDQAVHKKLVAAHRIAFDKGLRVLNAREGDEVEVERSKQCPKKSA